MCLHRLLQRGFASLFGYKSKPSHALGTSLVGTFGTALTKQEPAAEYANALTAENMTDLHYKLKGVRV